MIKFIRKRRAVVTDDDCKIFGKRQYTILQMLHDAKGEIVSRDTLVSAVWPNATPAEPLHSLAASINHMKPAVTDLGVHIECDGDGYRMEVLS